MNKVTIIGDFTSDEELDIRRSLMLLYGTREGEAALDRNYGLSWDCIDMPVPQARAMLTEEIITKTETYEPRATVTEVSFGTSEDGTISPEVIIECQI
jgi:phage baseplate assembly protein W